MEKIYSPGYRSQFLQSFFSSTQPHSNPPAGHESAYVVIKIGCGIYGIGSTRDAAIRAAREILFPGTERLSIPDYVPGKKPMASLYVAPCTRALADTVKARGGTCALPYTINQIGQLDLLNEQDRISARLLADRLIQANGPGMGNSQCQGNC